LFVEALAASGAVRVIGVDGRIGPILEEELERLCKEGISGCTPVPLAYEATDTGLGWFRAHHHHMHVSFLEPGASGGAGSDVEVALKAKSMQSIDQLRATTICLRGPCRVELTGRAVLIKGGPGSAAMRKQLFKLRTLHGRLETGERTEEELKFEKHRTTVRKMSRLISRRGFKGKVELRLIGSSEGSEEATTRTITELRP
jgi:hypothetical protein